MRTESPKKNSKKVILFLSTYPDISGGGDSRVAWELARYLAGHTTHDVWMLCPHTHFRIKRDHSQERLLVHTVPSIHLAEGVSIFSPSLARVNRVYQILDEIHPDIVHSHNIDPLSFVTQGWCLKTNIPFVYTGHVLASKYNDWNVLKLGQALEALTKISLETYSRQFYKNCTRIICLNELARNDFEKFIKHPEKLTIIPNGIQLNTSPKLVHVTEDNELKLIFSGYLSERKNQSYLVEMLRHLSVDKPVILFLAGTFLSNSYKKLMDKIAGSLPKSRNVRFLGYVDHETLIKKLSTMHYFVSAAKAEVQSLSVIEALASGTPVIALPNSTTVELIKNNQNGYLLPEGAKPTEFAKVLSGYLKIANSEYDLLSKRARHSIEIFEYRTIAQKHLDLYHSLTLSARTSESRTGSLDDIFTIFDRDTIRKIEIEGSHQLLLGAVSTVVRPALGAVALRQRLMPLK